MAAYVATNQLPARVAECYRTVAAITPTDATAIGPFVALYVGGGGDVELVPMNATTPVLFKAVPTGTLLRVAFQGINSTGTTATNMVGLG